MTTAERTARIATLKIRRTALESSILSIITTGQAYSAENRMMTRADLARLQQMERDTANEIGQLERCARGPRFYKVLYR